MSVCPEAEFSQQYLGQAVPLSAKVNAEEVQGQGKGSEAAEAAAAQQVAVETLKPSSKPNFP